MVFREGRLKNWILGFFYWEIEKGIANSFYSADSFGPPSQSRLQSRSRRTVQDERMDGVMASIHSYCTYIT